MFDYLKDLFMRLRAAKITQIYGYIPADWIYVTRRTRHLPDPRKDSRRAGPQ